MRKIALFLSLCVFIWASDLQQALEYEKQDFSSRLALANILVKMKALILLALALIR